MNKREDNILLELNSWISVFKSYRELLYGPELCNSDCLHLLEVLENTRDLIESKQVNP